ncbi:MAG: hypothetical protein JW839_10410 [Candidatus Lokiarchaeota archaeon]|nr:hypothetical protein [Candidatus Lokiarchaeota archaeon]
MSTQKKGYLGFLIAGGVASASGGSLLAMGLVYMWMGGLFQSMMDDIGGMPVPISGIFGAMGVGMAIGGGAALVVGLALLGTGVSKRNAYKASSTPQAGTATHWASAPATGREYPYSPAPTYGTISPPVASPPANSPAPRATRCPSCGEDLPDGLDATFCPSCGAPTR